MKLLSILITTLDTRKAQFEALKTELERQIRQHNLSEDVELLHFSDNFDYPVGLKRNVLLEAATGLFTVFVDDDDLVSEDYVQLITDTIKKSPTIDCIGITGKVISQDLGNKIFLHSIRHTVYSEDEKFYYRPPNHLNPIRAEIAKQFKFPVINRGEDFDWAMQLSKSGLLNKEIFIDKVIYYYLFEWSKTDAQKVKEIIR